MLGKTCFKGFPFLGLTGYYMGVSKNNGTPKSSILKRFSIINHPFWIILGYPYFWRHPYTCSSARISSIFLGNMYLLFLFERSFFGSISLPSEQKTYAHLVLQQELIAAESFVDLNFPTIIPDYQRSRSSNLIAMVQG